VRLVEASIAELGAALGQGRTTAVALAAGYLRRIAALDRRGPRLNAVPVLNPRLFDEARASDIRRARGGALGPLDGIPYTAKASFSVKGLPLTAGSPAFAGLVAGQDAFAIERLRAAGAVLIGLTNMPPMANGGMQRGLYGRAESPYSTDWLTAAFASGSSNGSGTATAASLAAFGLAEETWSSGRAPAANNGLCAYTPSRGVISTRGNWPLVPTMDVVVPHTRTMADLLTLLDVLVAEDAETRGDLWRRQPWVALPRVADWRPASFAALADGASLAGLRLGVPAMYINADPLAGTAPNPGIGGPTGQRIVTRPSMLALFQAARRDLTAAGATVVTVDFPVISSYEGDRPGAPTLAMRGLVSADYLRREITDLSVWAWDDFLQANGDPALSRLAQVDGALIFPRPRGALPDRYAGFDDDICDYPDHARRHPPGDFRAIPGLAKGLSGLEATRRLDLEDWMDRLALDAVIFPAVADIGPADADVTPSSADRAWANGVWVANGNLAIRHLGIPTVTVPMGVLDDIGMPAGLTFAGRAHDDARLLALAAAFEATGNRRRPPPLAPELDPLPDPLPDPQSTSDLTLAVTVTGRSATGQSLAIQGAGAGVTLTVNGAAVPVREDCGRFTADTHTPAEPVRHSDWGPPHGDLILATTGQAAAFAEVPQT
jgi:amidase